MHVEDLKNYPLCNSQTENIFNHALKSDFIIEKVTFFLIFLQNFIKIKSRSKTSQVFFTNGTDSQLNIHNCKIYLLFYPPSSLQTLNITNSIFINDLYLNDEMNHHIQHHQPSNTNIDIRQCYLVQNMFTSSFKNIKIHNCNKVLRITAKFETIEINGIFDSVKILGQFFFHFKSEEFATFFFSSNEKCLKAYKVVFHDNSFFSFIHFQNIAECKIELI